MHCAISVGLSFEHSNQVEIPAMAPFSLNGDFRGLAPVLKHPGAAIANITGRAVPA